MRKLNTLRHCDLNVDNIPEKNTLRHCDLNVDNIPEKMRLIRDAIAKRLTEAYKKTNEHITPVVDKFDATQGK